jgi:hypothetical protein
VTRPAPRALLLALFVACLVGTTSGAVSHAESHNSERPLAIERASAAISPTAFVALPPLRGARPAPVSGALAATALLALAASCAAIVRRHRNPVPAFRFPAPRLRGPPAPAISVS